VSEFLQSNELDLILDQVYKWSRDRQYRGYNKHDGLNSPILNTLFRWNKWSRIFAIQGVMRLPINVRPLLLTPLTYNPKGLSLFIRGLLCRYQSHQHSPHLEEAQKLLNLLIELRSPGNWSGICWGYHYPWQDLGFYAKTNTPNAVVTCFVCEAFLETYCITKDQKLLAIVGDAINFLINDLVALKNSSTELCLSYMPIPMKMRVMDVSILIGSVLAQYCAFSKNYEHMDNAKRLVNYVVNQQMDYGAWFYTDPPQDSHIRHDNYHTGFILDALWKYMQATKNNDYHKNYQDGLEFYAQSLFNNDGSPRWMSDKDFPHDIHGAAQGIITFSRHLDSYPDLSQKIASWTLKTLYNSCGRFYYQQTRFYTKRFTLLRWCNAWMAFALAQLELETSRN
jgi:hypothetical protein